MVPACAKLSSDRFSKSKNCFRVAFGNQRLTKISLPSCDNTKRRRGLGHVLNYNIIGLQVITERNQLYLGLYRPMGQKSLSNDPVFAGVRGCKPIPAVQGLKRIHLSTCETPTPSVVFYRRKRLCLNSVM